MGRQERAPGAGPGGGGGGRGSFYLLLCPEFTLMIHCIRCHLPKRTSRKMLFVRLAAVGGEGKPSSCHCGRLGQDRVWTWDGQH